MVANQSPADVADVQYPRSYNVPIGTCNLSYLELCIDYIYLYSSLGSSRITGLDRAKNKPTDYLFFR